MFSIRKISPMVRAVGTMGAVAALVGGITFAQLSSSPVTLTNDTLDSATASLGIGLSTSCTTSSNTQTGMDFTNLLPGVASSPFAFCLTNTGGASTGTPLNLTISTPTTDNIGNIPFGDVTLAVTCGGAGTDDGSAVNFSATLSSINNNPTSLSGNALSNTPGSNVWTCQATATLANSVTTSGGTVTPFELDFVGTSTES
jgi:hypothetical protein